MEDCSVPLVVPEALDAEFLAEEIARIQRQRLEDEDFFLASQLQQAEYVQQSYLESQARQIQSPNKHEKVSSTNFDPMLEVHFQSPIRRGDYERDEDLVPKNSYSFRKPQRCNEEEFPALGSTGSRREPRSKFLKNELENAANTVQQREGIDFNTAHVLSKLLFNGTIQDIQNIVSQNKEAFLFLGKGSKQADSPCLIKVFKYCKTDLKKREIYIQGEWRFRYQQNHLNPKTMLKLWAEKEFRNLKRLQKSNIPCLEPMALKGHLIILGCPEQRLYPHLGYHISFLSKDEKLGLYWQVVKLIKRMFTESLLIHAGLNQYSLLVHNGNLLLVDLGKAVSVDHPFATHFLRRDCWNMTDFFRSHGIEVLPTRQLYEFINRKSDVELGIDREIMNMQGVLSQGIVQTQQDIIDEMIWLDLDLPGSLKDVFSPCDIPQDSIYQSAIDALNLVK